MNREKMLRELVERLDQTSEQMIKSGYDEGYQDACNYISDELEKILNSGGDGWVLVPRKPTKEMLSAMGKQPVAVLRGEDFAFADRSEAYELWGLAISAAPTHPTEDKP